MTPIVPTRPKRLKIPKAKPEYNEDGEQVYCICRQPDKGELMIQCDHCKEWYLLFDQGFMEFALVSNRILKPQIPILVRNVSS
jgi:hypothetical protein